MYNTIHRILTCNKTAHCKVILSARLHLQSFVYFRFGLPTYKCMSVAPHQTASRNKEHLGKEEEKEEGGRVRTRRHYI